MFLQELKNLRNSLFEDNYNFQFYKASFESELDEFERVAKQYKISLEELKLM